MGPGFKYHIVTIAAIFFALTVGLVVGSLYVSPQVADGQKRAILGLRDTINKDVAAQRAEIERYQKFVGQAAPLLINRRMKGEAVAIVQTGDYPEAVEKVRAILAQANARVVSVTHIDEAFNRSDERLQAQLATLKEEAAKTLEGDFTLPANRDELAASLASILTRQSQSPDYLLPLLEDANYLHAEPNALFTKPVRYVVIVAGSRTNSDRVSNVDMPLIAALQKAGARVVACEPANSAASDIAAYHALNVNAPAIENIDSDIGPCALIMALRGEKNEDDAKEPKETAQQPEHLTPNTQHPTPKNQRP